MKIMHDSVKEEYRAVQRAVGWLDLSRRGKLEVRGPDRVSFLHAMISNDVETLEPWAGRYGTFLTARGKMMADFFYYKLPELILLDIDGARLSQTMQTLNRYIVMDEVELRDGSAERSHLSLQGPRSAELVQAVLGTRGPSRPLAVEPVSWEETEIWLIRKDQLADTGFELIVESPVCPALQEILQEKGKPLGLRQIRSEAHDVLRLEAGIPWFGVDMDENRYPMEARLEEAISLDKGCYIGQEVVAKATHIGGVANLLMGLKLKGAWVPPPDSKVKSGEKQIGKITSATFSPRFECPIALAYLKRAFARPGEHCVIETAEGKTALAEVVDRFA